MFPRSSRNKKGRTLRIRERERMPVAIFVNAAGARQEVDVPNGVNLVEAAIDKGVQELAAICGGYLQCATCHVFVEEDFLNRLPPRSVDEDSMLDSTAEPRRENSRLACQIVMNDTLTGIVVHMPDRQM
ncbi:Ferredoxin, 2Fe-2s [Granulibacter bethesdensis]|uniref:Ferredoxin, 2Fe-2s n=2 Tax=Granulibacter bethesdensis TaxID=364410 RepID=Q0BTF5_GRABC|nr:Ferredoxin, 2Fe-2s [Granulibacter bethesdensis CGDNIH1]AHJ66604.1 Ferredoxin, 2Fe-2s [Granulibacter bethesdensis CGDNIH4]AHJ69214.1 Ferredoxin, 2Fe-2s [Granulibacter bethesdensis]APH51711.1 Ferredoxin, 2Fe-2s [Granulibacter bethesdensis]APH59333.1 Ferredoxin, 2Fe-2s [Granulibacter bethesdensis]